MNPIDDSDAYVLLVLGNPAPGVVEILEADNEGNWDDKEATEQEGASTTYQGRLLRAFKSRHSLIVDPLTGVDEISDWATFVALLDSATSGTTPVAFAVWHPDLAVQGISDATPRKISVLKHDGYGGATAEVTWKEHRPPKAKPAVGTGGSKAGSKTGANGAKTYADTKLDEAKAESEALDKEPGW